MKRVDRDRKRRSEGRVKVQARQTQRQRDAETAMTYALARTTLKITSQSVSGAHVQACMFKAACRFNTPKCAHILWASTLLAVIREVIVHVSWSSKAVLEMAALGAHAKRSNVALYVVANASLGDTRREHDAAHAHDGAWVALVVLADAHVGIGVCPAIGTGLAHREAAAFCNGVMLSSDQSTLCACTTRGLQLS